MVINFQGWILYSAILLLILLLFVMKVLFKKSFAYLFFFSIMYIYLCFVIDYTQFPIYTTESMRRVLGPLFWQKNFNLIPFKGFSLETSLLNILLTMPFGFGLPFVYKSNFKRIVIASIIIGVIIESLQLIIGLINGFTFRVVDINDVIFNFIGSMIGYAIFVLFSKIFTTVVDKNKIQLNPLLKHIYKS